MPSCLARSKGSEDETQVFIWEQQALYQLSHLPSPVLQILNQEFVSGLVISRSSFRTFDRVAWSPQIRKTKRSASMPCQLGYDAGAFLASSKHDLFQNELILVSFMSS